MAGYFGYDGLASLVLHHLMISKAFRAASGIIPTAYGPGLPENLVQLNGLCQFVQLLADHPQPGGSFEIVGILIICQLVANLSLCLRMWDLRLTKIS